MPMGTSWSWVPNERYKSTDEIIRTLAQVVSRGGSLLLNVAPGPDGRLDSTAYVRMHEVGDWLRVNGEAVYGTRGVSSGKGAVIGTTGSADGAALYVIGVADGSTWSIPWPTGYTLDATLLGGGKVQWRAVGTGSASIQLPKKAKGVVVVKLAAP